MKANAKGEKLISANAESCKNLTTKKLSTNGDIHYNGKNGEEIKTSAVGVSVGIGVSKETTTVINKSNGEVVEQSDTKKISASPYPLTAASVSFTQTDVENIIDTGVEAGGSVGLFLNFSITLKAGVKMEFTKLKNDENILG